jgi:hypothetical protein
MCLTCGCRDAHVEMGEGGLRRGVTSSEGLGRLGGMRPASQRWTVTRLHYLLIGHRRWVQALWLVGMAVLGACQPDSNGGGAPGGDGY